MQSSSLYEIHKKGGGDGGGASDKKVRKLITGGDIICGGILFGTVEYLVEHLWTAAFGNILLKHNDAKKQNCKMWEVTTRSVP